MAQVFLSIGSNVDRDKHIGAALDTLDREFGELRISSVYESEAVGFDGDPFYNLVVGLHTSQDLQQLVAQLKRIEDENGRNRGQPRFSSRTLDIDILLYDQLCGRFDGVELPRAEITENAFVLWPLAEIAGDVCHPISGKSFAELWQAYAKPQKLWAVDFDWRGQRISRKATGA